MDNQLELQSLYDAYNEQLLHLPDNTIIYKNISEFIEDDKQSAEFINKVVFNDKSMYLTNVVAQGRARHSVISYFLGLVIGDFCGLLGNCSNIFNCNNLGYLQINEPYINYRLWLITSTNHDYGYFSQYVKTGYDLEKAKYNLLSDNDYGLSILTNVSRKYPRIFKNTYEDINNYYLYSQYFNQNGKGDKFEKRDHGILGGVLLFNKIFPKIKGKIVNKESVDFSLSYMNRAYIDSDVLFYKAACLTICQHNIFKSDGKIETENNYKKYHLEHLLKQSGYSVGLDTPLLALLSLVDTIECIKSFSKRDGKKTGLRTKTILKNIKIGVTKDEILLDYTDLYNYITKDEGRLNVLKNCIDNIERLPTWTDFKVEHVNNDPYRLSISHKKK